MSVIINLFPAGTAEKVMLQLSKAAPRVPAGKVVAPQPGDEVDPGTYPMVSIYGSRPGSSTLRTSVDFTACASTVIGREKNPSVTRSAGAPTIHINRRFMLSRSLLG